MAEKEDETFKDKLPGYVATAVATVTAAVAGSFLGVAGTLTGMFLASLAGGVLTHAYQSGYARANRAARAKIRKLRAARDRGLITDREFEHLYRPAAAAIRPRRLRLEWRATAAVAGAALLATLAVVTTAEAIAHKPLSSVVTGHRGSGFSVDPGPGGAPETHPDPTPSAASATHTTPSVTPSTTLSATPAVTSAATPSASTSTTTPTPSPPSSPASPPPSPSPDVAPSAP